MSFTPSAYRSKIYRDFKEIDSCEYRAIIRFFEENQEHIRTLELEEYFELMVSYLGALFEIGAYDRYLRLADGAIETSIIHNIHFFRGEDVYRKLLFRKAAAHYNMMQYTETEHICRELIKMDPRDEHSIKLLKRSLWKKKPAYVKHTRGLSISLLILAAAIIAVELFTIRPFFPDYTSSFEASRIFVFSVGLIAMFIGDVFHQLRINISVGSFVKKMHVRKKT